MYNLFVQTTAHFEKNKFSLWHRLLSADRCDQDNEHSFYKRFFVDFTKFKIRLRLRLRFTFKILPNIDCHVFYQGKTKRQGEAREGEERQEEESRGEEGGGGEGMGGEEIIKIMEKKCLH